MKKITLNIVSFSLILALSGCSGIFGPKEPTFVASKDYSMKVLKEVKEIDNKQAYQMEDLGLFKNETLPAYLGASSVIKKSDYFLKKYNHEPLLYPNFGVKNYIYFLIDTKDWNTAEARAQSYGYKNVKQLYSRVYKTIHENSYKEIYTIINELHNRGIVNKNNIFNKKNIEKMTSKIISTIYAPYMKFEGMTQPEILPEWFAKFDEKKITFSREDYKPFALTILIVNELISHKNEKRENINEFF